MNPTSAGKRPVMKPARDDEQIGAARSEEHTSELQSLMRISYAVFCLKKKKNNIISNYENHKDSSNKVTDVCIEKPLPHETIHVHLTVRYTHIQRLIAFTD